MTGHHGRQAAEASGPRVGLAYELRMLGKTNKEICSKPSAPQLNVDPGLPHPERGEGRWGILLGCLSY
jgi:hypothetical protein